MTADYEFTGDRQLSASGFEGRRQQALDQLTEAFAADKIHMEEYESRVAVAQNARDNAELDRALNGLQIAPRTSASSTLRHSATSVANRIDDRISGTMNLACVMGERNLNGDWLSGDHIGSMTLMGSTKIDLRDTALPPGRLKIDAFVAMGEMRVIVPRGLPVRVNAFPFMGETQADRDVEHRIEPGRPYVEINGFAFMGSIRVISGD